MAHGYFIENGTARELKKAFVGVNGIARRLRHGYVGINGIARKIYPWKSGNVDLSNTTVILDRTLTATVTAANATGDLTIFSSDTSVATASLSGNTITICGVSGLSSGSVATITVHVAESYEYTEADFVITVSVPQIIIQNGIFTDEKSDYISEAQSATYSICSTGFDNGNPPSYLYFEPGITPSYPSWTQGRYSYYPEGPYTEIINGIEYTKYRFAEHNNNTGQTLYEKYSRTDTPHLPNPKNIDAISSKLHRWYICNVFNNYLSYIGAEVKKDAYSYGFNWDGSTPSGAGWIEDIILNDADEPEDGAVRYWLNYGE